jgi:hypothetical protein
MCLVDWEQSGGVLWGEGENSTENLFRSLKHNTPIQDTKRQLSKARHPRHMNSEGNQMATESERQDLKHRYTPPLASNAINAR